jgi:hypothetical protein
MMPTDACPKLTDCYEQASYAIQDTPDTAAEHYGRFLPRTKRARPQNPQSGVGSGMNVGCYCRS